MASIPFAGEAVTDTVAPRGRKAAWSSAFLSGTSSKVGVSRTLASAAAWVGVREERRRNSIPGYTSESGIEALRLMMNSRSASSMASSSGGASYSASIRFQIAFARWAASRPPSSSHCS